MTKNKFEEILEQETYKYEVRQGSFVVTHHEYVVLRCIWSMPPGVHFNNDGDVFLNYLETLQEGVQFNNGGNVYLKHLQTLQENVQFNNKGNVFLRSIETLPDGVQFNNKGNVVCPMVEGLHTYLGQKMEFKYIDDYTMIIENKKMVGGYEVYNARFFQGGPIEDMGQCYVAKKGDYHAHGETIRDAIEDVRFKAIRETDDIGSIVEEIEEKQTVTPYQYRLITGACRLGCKQFLEQNGLEDKTELPLKQVLELTEDQYGGDKMQELFN